MSKNVICRESLGIIVYRAHENYQQGINRGIEEFQKAYKRPATKILLPRRGIDMSKLTLTLPVSDQPAPIGCVMIF